MLDLVRGRMQDPAGFRAYTVVVVLVRMVVPDPISPGRLLLFTPPCTTKDNRWEHHRILMPASGTSQTVKPDYRGLMKFSLHQALGPSLIRSVLLALTATHCWKAG